MTEDANINKLKLNILFFTVRDVECNFVLMVVCFAGGTNLSACSFTAWQRGHCDAPIAAWGSSGCNHQGSVHPTSHCS